MRDLADQLTRLSAEGGRGVLATLVATHGARPRDVGARLLVREDGSTVGSVTLGGCVEQRVVDIAREVLGERRPRVLLVNLAEEEALDLGMGCAAILELLVEPVGGGLETHAALTRDAALVRDHVARGGRAAVVVRTEAPDATLVLLDDGTTRGSLGSDALDVAARAPALDAMERRTSVLLPAEGERPRLFIDVHAPPRTLYVFGVGPVTAPLLDFARPLGLRSVLVVAEAGAARRGDLRADDVRSGALGEVAQQLAPDRDSAIVILAHDYKHELPVLERVLAREVGYVGVLGNRRRGQALLDTLAARGVSAEALARVRVPAGLDLGAESPAEIALAILAEIIAAFAGRPAR